MGIRTTRRLAMKKWTVVALAFGLAGAAMSASAIAHDGKHEEKGGEHSKSIVGELVDTACFVSSEGDAKGSDHAECAAKCLGTGVPAGILPEGSTDPSKMMFLLTNPSVLAPHAGKTIKVEGTSHEKMHSIDVKKLFVKEGNDWKEVQLKDEHHNMAGSDEAKEGHKGHGH
jgi:hypothetical protein